MRKYGERKKRLELWWQLYRTSLPERDVRNITPMDFCSTECTRRCVPLECLLSDHFYRPSSHLLLSSSQFSNDKYYPITLSPKHSSLTLPNLHFHLPKACHHLHLISLPSPIAVGMLNTCDNHRSLTLLWYHEKSYVNSTMGSIWPHCKKNQNINTVYYNVLFPQIIFHSTGLYSNINK